MNENVVAFMKPEVDREFRDALQRRLVVVQAELDRLKSQRTEVDALIRHFEEEQGHLGGLLGHQTALDEGVSEVSESASDLVYRLLAETGPLHYRDIEREVRTRGWYTAGGVDAASTLLSKFFKDPRFFRPSRGVYAIQSAETKRKSAGVRSKTKGRAGSSKRRSNVRQSRG